MKRQHSDRIIKELFSIADIEINGTRPWDIQVHDRRFYRRVAADRSLGLGESYMDGWWDCAALDECLCRLLREDIEGRVRRSLKLSLHVLKAKCFNLQSMRRAHRVAEQHYNLGNDIFEATLDKLLLYTCGYWKDAQTLDDAQEAKLELICRKLNLQPGMKVIDIGCGFGGFAKYAAEHCGVEVVGITNSKAHLEFGRQLCSGLPVEIRLQDYRSIEGTFDRVVTIGCLEHIGYKNYRTYMKTIHRCLRDDGIALLHTMGINWTTLIGDHWVTKYIFPNGMTPSIRQLGAAMENLFVVEDWHNFGTDYDRTLLAWHENFERAWPQLSQHYDERFHRMWRYYLLFFAAMFRARTLQLWQIVMTKPGAPQPACRIS